MNRAISFQHLLQQSLQTTMRNPFERASLVLFLQILRIRFHGMPDLFLRKRSENISGIWGECNDKFVKQDFHILLGKMALQLLKIAPR